MDLSLSSNLLELMLLIAFALTAHGAEVRFKEDHSSEGNQIQYRAVVQRLGKFYPLLAIIIVGLGFGSWWAISFEGYQEGNAAMMKVVGGFVLAILWALSNAYRVHLWTLEVNGLRVRERPRIPLTGLRRRAFIPYADISDMQFSGSGAKRSLQVTARDGRRFGIDQTVKNDPQSRFLMADPAAYLGDLEQAIRARAALAGNQLAPTSQGLSYFQTIVGLSVVAILFLLTVPLSGLLVWAIWEGATPSSTTRLNIEALLVFLLAPALFGWLFVKMLKDRRRILNSQPVAQPPGPDA